MIEFNQAAPVVEHKIRIWLFWRLSNASIGVVLAIVGVGDIIDESSIGSESSIFGGILFLLLGAIWTYLALASGYVFVSPSIVVYRTMRRKFRIPVDEIQDCQVATSVGLLKRVHPVVHLKSGKSLTLSSFGTNKAVDDASYENTVCKIVVDRINSQIAR